MLSFCFGVEVHVLIFSLRVKFSLLKVMVREYVIRVE